MELNRFFYDISIEDFDIAVDSKYLFRHIKNKLFNNFKPLRRSSDIKNQDIVKGGIMLAAYSLLEHLHKRKIILSYNIAFENEPKRYDIMETYLSITYKRCAKNDNKHYTHRIKLITTG